MLLRKEHGLCTAEKGGWLRERSLSSQAEAQTGPGVGKRLTAVYILLSCTTASWPLDSMSAVRAPACVELSPIVSCEFASKGLWSLPVSCSAEISIPPETLHLRNQGGESHVKPHGMEAFWKAQ